MYSTFCLISYWKSQIFKIYGNQIFTKNILYSINLQCKTKNLLKTNIYDITSRYLKRIPLSNLLYFDKKERLSNCFKYCICIQKFLSFLSFVNIYVFLSKFMRICIIYEVICIPGIKDILQQRNNKRYKKFNDWLNSFNFIMIG